MLLLQLEKVMICTTHFFVFCYFWEILLLVLILVHVVQIPENILNRKIISLDQVETDHCFTQQEKEK